MNFKDLVLNNINETMIILDKKPYPTFGNVVILAGGSASGKGFVKDKLLAIEGVTIDVDEIKRLSLKSKIIKDIAKEKYGLNMDDMSLENPEDVYTLHNILMDMKIIGDMKKNLYTSILAASPERKPNIIFDNTLKDIGKLYDITTNVIKLGYKKENIHLIWVINDIKVSTELNKNKIRGRVVPEDILISTHEGAALTIKKLIDMKDLGKYLDGSIILVFNKKDQDTKIRKSNNGGEYIEKANYVVVKKAGKPIDKQKITQEVLDKIREYTPKINAW